MNKTTLDKVNRKRLDALVAIYEEITTRARGMETYTMGQGMDDARILNDLANAALALEQSASETYQMLADGSD